MNSFYGPIPRNFSRGNILRNLTLNSNRFEGQLPRSLIHCTVLELLNLGNNNIRDGFPYWLEVLPALQVLVLLSNPFHGPIGNPISSNPFPELQILDLSHNAFTGLLPTKYLENVRCMTGAGIQNVELTYVGEYYYEDSLIVTAKGLDMELVRILTTFTTIDLSCNGFEGQIPEIIGNFTSLLVLTLSHNGPSGYIPSYLGNMAALESLDLSCNKKFVGEIPEELRSLNFLAFLNLLQNLL